MLRFADEINPVTMDVQTSQHICGNGWLLPLDLPATIAMLLQEQLGSCHGLLVALEKKRQTGPLQSLSNRDFIKAEFKPQCLQQGG
jgi:hypothetical protein